MNSLQAILAVQRSAFQRTGLHCRAAYQRVMGEMRERSESVDLLGFHQILLGVLHLGGPPGCGAASDADIRRVVGHDIEVRVW